MSRKHLRCVDHLARFDYSQVFQSTWPRPLYHLIFVMYFIVYGYCHFITCMYMLMVGSKIFLLLYQIISIYIVKLKANKKKSKWCVCLLHHLLIHVWILFFFYFFSPRLVLILVTPRDAHFHWSRCGFASDQESLEVPWQLGARSETWLSPRKNLGFTW